MIAAILTGPAIAVAILAVGAGGFAQGVTGFGFSLVCAPVLVTLTGGADGVRLVDTLVLAVNVTLLAREHSGVRWADAVRLLAPAMVVAPVVAILVRRADPGAVSVAAGVAILLAAASLALGLRVRRLQGGAGAVGAGAVSAAMNVTGGVSGPAVALYAVNAGWPQPSMRPTLQVYFFALNLLSVVVLGPVSPGLAAGAGMVVAVAVGGLVGVAVANRVDHAVISRAILVVAAVGGLAAVARGLAS